MRARNPSGVLSITVMPPLALLRRQQPGKGMGGARLAKAAELLLKPVEIALLLYRRKYGATNLAQLLRICTYSARQLRALLFDHPSTTVVDK